MRGNRTRPDWMPTSIVLRRAQIAGRTCVVWPDIHFSSNAGNQALGQSKAVVKDSAEAGGFDHDEAWNPLGVPYRRIWSIGTAVRAGGAEGPGTTRPPEFPVLRALLSELRCRCSKCDDKERPTDSMLRHGRTLLPPQSLLPQPCFGRALDCRRYWKSGYRAKRHTCALRFVPF